MKLLKNQQEFEEWKKVNIFDGDVYNNPQEYPCYAKIDVLNWTYKHEKAVYLYLHDIEEMLMSFSSDTPCCGGGPQWGHFGQSHECPE
jgi:hypothetical protein